MHTYQQPPWFSPDIRHLINHPLTVHCIFRNHPTKPIDEKVKALEALSQADYSLSLVNEYTHSQNYNETFKYIKTI